MYDHRRPCNIGGDQVEASSIFGLFVFIGLSVAFFFLLFWGFSKLFSHHSKNKFLAAVLAAITELAFFGVLSYYLALGFNYKNSPPMSPPPETREWQETIDRIGLPEIPLLPPSSASASYMLSDHAAYCQTRSAACGTLLTLAADIVLSIRDAGFPEVAIFFGYDGRFDVLPKVIIVTPTERVYPIW